MKKKGNPIQINEYNAIRNKAMIDYNDWLKHKIESEPINDLNELKVFLDDSTIHLKEKLKGIRKNKELLQIHIAKQKLELVQLQEYEMKQSIKKLKDKNAS